MEITRKSIERSAKHLMVDQGVYHPSFKPVLRVLTDMIYEYMRMAYIDTDSHVMGDVKETLFNHITEYGDRLKLDKSMIESIISDNKSMTNGRG